LSNHKITHYEVEGGRRARCRCGFQTLKYEHQWQVDDEVEKHHAKIERVRAYLETRNPTVKSQYQFFSEKADDPDETPENRALWRQLADELAPRVKDKKPAPQETLFPMEPPKSDEKKGRQT